MTPKGLLRLKQAGSTLEDLASGEFRPVLDDPSHAAGEDRERVERLVFCQGKIYYDIVGHEQREGATGVAVARIEQLYPFPTERVRALFAGYPNLREVVWAQEEPQNMGPWRAIRHRLEENLPEGVGLRYIGRPWRASPSEGYPTAHLREQDRIIREALS
jgi:2-oxoglutarate dehydrogenase E1 component